MFANENRPSRLPLFSNENPFTSHSEILFCPRQPLFPTAMREAQKEPSAAPFRAGRQLATLKMRVGAGGYAG